MSDRRAFGNGMPWRTKRSVETDTHEAMILRNWPSTSLSHRRKYIPRQFHPPFNEHGVLQFIAGRGQQQSWAINRILCDHVVRLTFRVLIDLIRGGNKASCSMALPYRLRNFAEFEMNKSLKQDFF
jgi:hypothetical protein